MKHFISLSICLASLLLWVNPLWSATVYLKNGQTIDGIVRDSGGSTVTVVTPGGTFNYPRDAILRVEETSNFNDLLIQARSHDNTGNFHAAILLFSEAINQTNSLDEKNKIIQQQRNVIQKYVNTIDQKDPLTEGLQAINEIEELKQHISDPTNLALLQAERKELDQKVINRNYTHAETQEKRQNYKEAIDSFSIILNHYPENPLASNLPRRITNLYVDWGVHEYRRNQLSRLELQNIFSKALELAPTNAIANYYMGRIAFENEEYSRAETFLRQVDASALPSRETSQLTNMIRRLDVINQPVVRPTRRPVQTPEPEPTPVPGMMGRVTNFFGNIWVNTKEVGTGIMGGSSDAFVKVIPLLTYLGIGFAILVVFWYIPMKILVWDLPKRNVIYHNWRKIVKTFGLLGLIWYFLDRWRREEPKKRCPACNRNIDNPELFENYDFSSCPYCEKRIKPPFTLPEVIQGRAQSMLISKSYSGGVQDEAQREQMINIVSLIMVYGRKIRASDIHIEPEQGNLLIRYRVDGVMTESIALDMQLNMAMVSSIKVICNLNIAERRLPQDGHFRRVILGDEINIRVSTIPTRGGEKIVMRLLDQKIASATLDSLGMRDEDLDAYRRAIKSPHGLILATGPTGSGKTTLQYASLQFINDGSKNITTVEDPIEYELEGINQVQHNTATGLTFATALRSILRQDPDVIMVGEIRDLETASIAVNAALTGHLVFSTLHTIDTSTALSRLIDIGVDVKLLSSAIINIVAQRLVRKLCPHCKKQVSVTSGEMKLLGSEAKTLEGKPIYKPRGCSECGGTGYIGRMGIYEMLVPNQDIRQLVEKGASATELRQASHDLGMKSLREEGVRKILHGITSVDEVIRVTSDDAFQDYSAKPDEETMKPSL